MDNFVDKLVDKINVQGQIRHQSITGTSSRDADVVKELTSRIDEMENKSIANISNRVSDKVMENNQKVVEMVSQYKESIEDSIHKENVRCYRNTQAMVEENIGKLPDQISDTINEKLVEMQESISNKTNSTVNSSISKLKGLVIMSMAASFLSLVGVIVILLWIFRII